MDTIALASYDEKRDSWYSPIFVISRFQSLGSMYGAAIANPEFKPAREMFTAAVALLGAYELDSSNKYCMQLNKQSASPDVMAAKQTQQGQGLPILLEMIQMEIVEFEDHFPSDDLIDFLTATKLSPKKSYTDKTMIVCLINKTIQVNHREIYERLNCQKVRTTIYIVGRSEATDPAHFILFCAYPSLTIPLHYQVFETAQKYSLPPRTSLHKGMDTKISYTKTRLTPFSLYEMFRLNEKRIKAKYIIQQG